MAVQAESSLISAHAYFWKRTFAALFVCAALVAVTTGVLGLLAASRLRQTVDSWINIHALFGLLLCALVIARCRWCVRYSPPTSSADIRRLSRHLSRIVYLLLYSVIGARLLIGIIGAIWHDGLVDLNLFDERFRGPDYAGFNAKDDFQLFLASGLITLIFIRVLAFRLWLRSDERAALSEPATGGVAGRALERPRERSDR